MCEHPNCSEMAANREGRGVGLLMLLWMYVSSGGGRHERGMDTG